MAAATGSREGKGMNSGALPGHILMASLTGVEVLKVDQAESSTA